MSCTVGFALLLALVVPLLALADIPATPVMTLYGFSSALDIPYYTIASVEGSRRPSPAGTLAQGTSVVPCLVIRNGRPLTNSSGTPFVGFEVVVDSRKAVRADTERFDETVAERKSMTVPNHHCSAGIKYVMNVRKMFQLGKEPFFDPATSAPTRTKKVEGMTELDAIVRAFHNSPQCAQANRRLIGRRVALAGAWERFATENGRRWSANELARAKHLDYTMRTALYEGHLDRGCSAYGACERNVIALSIRNRGGGACSGRQGCNYPGDFQGVSSKISQYNIWDEFLTQISGLSSCFLREDLSGEGVSSDGEQGVDFNAAYYRRIRRMYEQSVPDVERILFGSDRDLAEVFPNTPFGALNGLRHYYHPPAMKKCFPNRPRVEYMSGAVARKGNDFALIANTRIEAGRKVAGGYLFKEFDFEAGKGRDVVTIEDNYPGFVVDGRKVSFGSSRKCSPYGVSRGCKFKSVDRYRTRPSWIRAGRAAKFNCRVRDSGEDCLGGGRVKTVSVGGPCDIEMQPYVGIK